MEEEKVVKKSTKRISNSNNDVEKTKKTSPKKVVKKSTKKTIEEVKSIKDGDVVEVVSFMGGG